MSIYKQSFNIITLQIFKSYFLSFIFYRNCRQTILNSEHNINPIFMIFFLIFSEKHNLQNCCGVFKLTFICYLYRGRRYGGHIFKFQRPGSFFKVNVPLTYDQKQFFSFLHFWRFAGQKCRKMHFLGFFKFLNTLHLFYCKFSSAIGVWKSYRREPVMN